MAFLKLFLDICLFRKGPHDTPASPVLFALVALIYYLAACLMLVQETDWSVALLQALVELGVLIGFVYAVLWITRKTPRFLQTATSFMATDTLISSPALILLPMWLAYPDVGFVQVLLLGLLLWHIAVIGHILRGALSCSLFLGIGVALLYVYVNLQIMGALFVPPA